MSLPIDLAERYARATTDFWRIGPAAFLSRRYSNGERYLSPYQFASFTIAILFSLYVAEATLNLSGLRRAGIETFDDPKALTIRLMVFMVCILSLGTALAWISSRLWPVSRKPSFLSLFHFSCYTTCLFLPFGVFDVLLTPVLNELAAEKVFPIWTVFITPALGYIAGTILFFIYWLPGLAFINDVSKKRMLTALMLWPNLLFGVPVFWLSFWLSLIINLSGPPSPEYQKNYDRGYRWGVKTRRSIEKLWHDTFHG